MATIIKWVGTGEQRRVGKVVMPEAEYHSLADQYLGMCLCCSEITGTVEPDAEGYHCTYCGQMAVMGAEQALLEGIIELSEE